jgi:DNA-binding HxlR family transcriptional regulator
VSATHKLVRIDEENAGHACPAVDEAVALLGNRWSLLVLGALRRGQRLRYNELQRAVNGISQRMLTLTLKKLEENGFVERTIFATVPPRVDYELTPLGNTLIQPVRALIEWTLTNRPAMAQARRAYALTAKKATPHSSR